MSTAEMPQDLDIDAGDLHLPPADGGGASILDHLAAKRQELAAREAKELVKLVPGWEGSLAIHYRYPEAGSDAIVRAVMRAQTGGKAEDIRDANTDVLSACCYQIVGRKPGGKWEPLDPGNPNPLRFTKRLADLLQIDVPDNVRSPARFIARHIFSPRAQATGIYDGDIALNVQAGQVIGWLQGGEDAADEALEGE